MKVGGAAEWLLEPANPGELVAACAAARERGLEIRVLGGGANLLVTGELLAGAVLTTERMARLFRPRNEEGVEWSGDTPEPAPRGADTEPLLVVWAGMPLPGLCRAARDLGWSGLEGLVGIPGQLGGGVAMNAGGRWGELWDVVESVRLLHPGGELEDRPRSACTPRYRDGNLGAAICVGAVLRLERGRKAEIQARMASYLAEKSAAQPVTERSSGCIFQNPDPELANGLSAGQLVEECGGKGLAVGDAMVSPKHGNFIVNRGAATASDVLALIEAVRTRVLERTGIALETEVRIWHGGPARG